MTKKRAKEWQSSFRKLPEQIVQKLKHMGPKVVVAGAKKITASEIESGRYSHLEIAIDGSQIISAVELLPPPRGGRFSARNVHGQEVVHKEEPKIKKVYSFEAPNWHGSGTHSVMQTRDVYRRSFVPPTQLGIQTELLREEVESGENIYIFKFSIDRVLAKDDPNFEEDLLNAVNLLQENTGVADVFDPKSEKSDFLATIQVDWEILPPGDREFVIDKIIGGIKNPEKRDELKEKVGERFATLAALNPKAYIKGTSGFRRYFGAMYADDLVAFENLDYGNAIYILFQNWEKLSAKSRLEILKQKDEKFVRIVHRKDWESSLEKTIKEEMQTRRFDPKTK